MALRDHIMALDIPLPSREELPEDLQKYFSVCDKKLGMVPNVLAAYSHDAEQLRAWTARFGRLFACNQWKREQLPVTMKVLDLDLDPKTGFRFPVLQSIDAELEELAASTLQTGDLPPGHGA